MPIRPEAEQKLRAGFQRRVDRQAARYAAQLAHARQLAVGLECGDVVGVFSGTAGGERRRGAYLTAYTLRCADGRTCEVSRSLRNVQDPYPNVGSPLRGLMPARVGATMPTFPTIDQVIATFPGTALGG